jgi:NADH-quinone oxidoreductase subunit A
MKPAQEVAVFRERRSSSSLEESEPLSPVWPLVVYFAAVVLVVTGMIGVSYVLGQRRRRRPLGPYEGGMVPTSSARLSLSVNFYLIAMFFVIFDLEAVFIYSWAVTARELGWAGYLEVLVFIGVLVAALVYLWRMGALDVGGAFAVRRGVARAGDGRRDQEPLTMETR